MSDDRRSMGNIISIVTAAVTAGLITVSTSSITGTLPVSKGGTGATTLTGALVGDGTNAVTAGTLSVANGGTGSTSLTQHSVMLGNGTSALSSNLVAPSTSGNVLTSNGTTWTSAALAAGLTPSTKVEQLEDFTRIASQFGPFGLFVTQTGTGASATSGIASPDSGHVGVHKLETGTDTTGVAAINSNASAYMVFGGGAHTLEYVVYLANLSDGTDTYTCRFGFNDSSSSTDGVDGYFFRYNSTVNSGKWECVTTSNSTLTATDSTVSATTGWTKLKIVVNAAGTQADFYINDVLKVSPTSNCPTGTGRETGLTGQMVKTAGTTTRLAYVDYIYWKWVPTVAR